MVFLREAEWMGERGGGGPRGCGVRLRASWMLASVLRVNRVCRKVVGLLEWAGTRCCGAVP